MKSFYLLLTACLLIVGCNNQFEEIYEPIYVEQFVDTIGSSRAIPTDYMVKTETKIYWNTGEQVILSHADSPEGGLHPSWQTQDAQFSVAVANRGITARTYTMRGDDVTAITPFSSGTTPDRAKMEGWKTRWLTFINAVKAKGRKPVIIVYIGERTNWYRTLSEYQSWLTVLSSVLRSGEDISGYFIFGIEEIGQRQGTTTLYSDNEIAAWWNPMNQMIKALFPYSITMLHNIPLDKFYQASNPPLQVDMINVQETSIGNMENTANDAISRGYAIHLHEWYGAIKASQSNDTNISKLDQQLGVSQRTGCMCSGIFANDIDTQRPDTNKLKNVHIHQGNYFFVNNPDDTVIITTYALHYAFNNTLNPNNTLQGETLSAGKVWIYIQTTTDIPNRPLKFYYDGIFINNESGRPYELKGGAGFTVSDGQHEVKVVDAQNVEIAKATFAVGNIVLPPDDTIVPPSTMEIVYSVNFSLNPSNVLDNGDVLPVGGMWFGVKQGTGAHTFILKRGTTTVNNVTDNTAPFQFKNNWLQMGSYTLTVNAEVRSFSVN